MNRLHAFPAFQNTGVAESAANTETVVLTVANVTSELDNPQVILTGSLSYTPPAAITSLTVRVRRDSLTGTLVDAAIVDAADPVATKLGAIAFDFVDQPAGQFQRSYVVTVQGTGEGAAGNCNAAHCTAVVG